jgi:tRNA (cmo5U34)-methyltransferase
MGKDTTNVKPGELNYERYSSKKYDRDIVNSIPHHSEIHEQLRLFITKNFDKNQKYSIIDLGVGTGITSKLFQDLLPNARLDVVDFSRKMLNSAKKRLGHKSVNYILGNYATLKFNEKYDIVVSVIGIHHQSNNGKKRLFKKIYSMLKPNGIFIFGDLVTYKNPHKAALNNALHYHYLVEHATDEKTLTEWAYHHLFLNDLAPIEDQIVWLKKTGFKVKTLLLQMGTALLACQK